MYIMQNCTLILMFIAFLCVCAYTVHSIYVTKQLKKLNNEMNEILKKAIKETSDMINDEMSKQLNKSLMSPIDYTKGTRKPKKGE